MRIRTGITALVTGAVLAATLSVASAPVQGLTLTPPDRVGGLIMTSNDYTSADFSWDVPNSYDLQILRYLVRSSSDAGATWGAPVDVGVTTASSLEALGNAAARLVEVAAVSSDGQGDWSAPLMVTTKGTRTMRVQVLTSDGKPVTGGAITWEMVPRTVWSSITYGLTSDGVIDFPSAPAGTVKVTIVNGLLPDGTFVAGRWVATLGFATTELRLPYVPPSVHRIHVTLPGGLPVANVSVDVPGLATSLDVGRFNFARAVGGSAGVTDSAGLFTAVGFASGTVEADLTYDDGVIGQTKAVTVTGSDTYAELEYAPFVVADASTFSGTAGQGVGVSLTAHSAGTSLRQASLHPMSGQSGVRVTLVPPKGASVGTCGARLSGLTNSQGKVSLRICATKSGVVRVRSTGALSARAFTLLVRGRPSLPVRSVTAKSRSAGSISVSWARPFFTGGASVVRYRVTASTVGATPVVRDVPVTSSATPLRRTITSLRHATRYVVRIYALTRYGWSDPYTVTVPVA